MCTLEGVYTEERVLSLEVWGGFREVEARVEAREQRFGGWTMNLTVNVTEGFQVALTCRHLILIGLFGHLGLFLSSN